MTQNQKSKTTKILAKHIQKSSADLESDNRLAPEVRDRIRLVNALVLQIFLDPKDIEYHNLLPWIKQRIQQFNLLGGGLCEFEVLIEAYTIAIKKTKEGYVIENLPAWFKGTTFNIIRNIKRELKRQDSIKNQIKYSQKGSEDVSPFSSIENSSVDERLQPLLKALETLDDAERALLNLRVVKGLTWSEIAEKMIQSGKEEPIEMEKLLARLRQRCSRILAKLRNNPNISIP